MKKSVLIIVGIVGVLSARWLEIHVPLSESAVPAALGSFDITHIKPGVRAELVVHEAELPALERLGIPYEVVIDDLEAYYASQMSGAGPFGDYYTHDEACAVLDTLHEQYPDIISERMILPNDDYDDLTWDGNHVYAVKISDNVAEEEAGEPEVLYTGLHHAREPVSVSICIEWARWLCENYGSDPLTTYLVDNRQIWIIPMVNPDGYLYNEEIAPGGGGMHRKNRRPGLYPNPGVDLNRNYPYMWGHDDFGSSGDPQNNTYRGPEPGSEPETQSVMNLCKEHSFVTALDFHSHSNLFLYPWGYAVAVCDDSTAFYKWGEASTRTSFYAVVPVYELYLVNGGAEDWMYGETEGKNRIFAVLVEVGEDFWQEPLVDEQVAENFPLLLATAKAAGTYLELGRVWWTDENQDGNISPGERVKLLVDLHNMSVRDSTGEIGLELQGTDSRIELIQSSTSIPSLGPQQSCSNELDIEVKLASTAPEDSAIALDLSLTAAGYEFLHTVILPVGDRNDLLAEDFDDQNSEGWSSAGWGFTPEHAHSRPYSITDSPYSSYLNNDSSYFESPKLDLTDKVIAEVSFWHRFSIQKGFDWGAFEVRSSDTDDWIVLKHWSGPQLEWLQERFDLTEFCGGGAEDFQIRFVLRSDDEGYLDGWYVDDVALVSFRGKVTTGGIHELKEIRPALGPRESITSDMLSFTGPEGTHVEAVMFDASGREVAVTEGTTPFSWQVRDARGRKLPKGAYFVKTYGEGRETTRKIVVVD